MDLGELLAANMQRRRRNAKISQGKFLPAKGWSRWTVSRIETGEVPMSMDEIALVCERLNCTLGDLLRGADPEVFHLLGIDPPGR